MSAKWRKTYIGCEFPVVQVTFEDYQLASFEVFEKVGFGFGQAPVASSLGPETVVTDDEPPFGEEMIRLSKEEGEPIELLLRQRL